MRVLCLASRDGGAPEGLLSVRVSAFPPSSRGGEERRPEESRAWPRFGEAPPRRAFGQTLLPQKVRFFSGREEGGSGAGVAGAGEAQDPARDAGTKGGPWPRAVAAAGAPGAHNGSPGRSVSSHLCGGTRCLSRVAPVLARPGRRGPEEHRAPQASPAAKAKVGAHLAPAGAGEGRRRAESWGGSSATILRPRPQHVGAVPILHAPWTRPVSAPHLAVTAEGCSSHCHQPLLAAQTLIKR